MPRSFPCKASTLTWGKYAIDGREDASDKWRVDGGQHVPRGHGSWTTMRGGEASIRVVATHGLVVRGTKLDVKGILERNLVEQEVERASAEGAELREKERKGE